MTDFIYINLNKAVASLPNASLDTPTPKRGVEEYEDSYERDVAGISGGDPSVDDPDKGKNWKHGGADKGKDFKEIKKSIQAGSTDVVKSFSKSMRQEYQRAQPMSSEMEYLVQVIGYTEEDVRKGLAVIKGRERSRFHDWLCKRFNNAAGKLAK